LFSGYGLERHEVTTLKSGSYATRMELTLSTKEEAGVLFNDELKRLATRPERNSD